MALAQTHVCWSKVRSGCLEFEKKDIVDFQNAYNCTFWPRLTKLTKIFAKLSVGKKPDCQ